MLPPDDIGPRFLSALSALSMERWVNPRSLCTIQLVHEPKLSQISHSVHNAGLHLAVTKPSLQEKLTQPWGTCWTRAGPLGELSAPEAQPFPGSCFSVILAPELASNSAGLEMGKIVVQVCISR